MKIEQLEKLGMKAAASNLKKKLSLKRKMSIAFEHFRYIKPEKFDDMNAKLKKNTLEREGKAGVDLYETYDRLKFIALAQYATIPPQEVLDKVEKAQELKCFDTFEVCKIESVKEYKDPIIFGCIKSCPHKFFIAQWDNDIKIEDILSKNEG